MHVNRTDSTYRNLLVNDIRNRSYFQVHCCVIKHGMDLSYIVL